MRCSQEACAPIEGVEEPVELRVMIADVEAELQKGTTGYLAHMASRHEEEVENARKLLRGWWDRRMNRRLNWRCLARFRPLSLRSHRLRRGTCC